MAQLLLLSARAQDQALPGLAMLGHRVRQAPLLGDPGQDADLVLVDAAELPAAFQACLALRGAAAPVIVLLDESGLAAVSERWGVADVMLRGAGPAEIDARIRLALAAASARAEEPALAAAGLVIDEANYSAKAGGHTLDLTYKEFELLRFLLAHPDRVFTREQILSEVWGYDYFGGTRTVDVHVRRLRAKLGEHEHLIGTVRNVGYRFNGSEDPHADDPDHG